MHVCVRARTPKKIEICKGLGLHDLDKVPMKQSSGNKDFLSGSRSMGVVTSGGLTVQPWFIVIDWKGGS